MLAFLNALFMSSQEYTARRNAAVDTLARKLLIGPTPAPPTFTSSFPATIPHAPTVSKSKSKLTASKRRSGFGASTPGSAPVLTPTPEPMQCYTSVIGRTGNVVDTTSRKRHSQKHKPWSVKPMAATQVSVPNVSEPSPSRAEPPAEPTQQALSIQPVTSAQTDEPGTEPTPPSLSAQLARTPQPIESAQPVRPQPPQPPQPLPMYGYGYGWPPYPYIPYHMMPPPPPDGGNATPGGTPPVMPYAMYGYPSPHLMPPPPPYGPGYGSEGMNTLHAYPYLPYPYGMLPCHLQQIHS